MYSVEFIAEFVNYDEDFQRLSDLIQEAAESSPGYIGKHLWQSLENSAINATYYWKNEESIIDFKNHPKHLQAKRQYTRWYSGYHVVISKVQRSYGDSSIAHITSSDCAKNA